MAEVDLLDYVRWLHKVANGLLPHDDPRHDDLVQEGHIAMWRALQTYDEAKGALPTWLTGAARLRMRDIAHGTGQYTGHQAHRGVIDAASMCPASLDEPVGSDGETFGEDLVDDDDLLDRVELAYHHGEIYAALGRLTEEQRAYVRRRFWEGETPKEIAADLGISTPLAAHRWRKTREALVEALEHLREVA